LSSCYDFRLENVFPFFQHPNVKNKLPNVDDLKEGCFLLGSVHEVDRNVVKLVRDSLVEQYGAESPTDFMLIDLLASNYVRAMYAARVEGQSIWFTDYYSMEMFEVAHQGLQPYIHACQNQMLKVLKALNDTKLSANVFTHETYSRTAINLETWGLPLLLALGEITETKEQGIGIDEIKLTMTRYVKGLDVESIPNSLIGYALGRFGFIEKVHVSDGQRYNIERKRVLTLLNESLKA
jgi:hypothetical protein